MSSSFIPRAFSTQYGANLGAVLHAPYLWDTDYALSQDEDSYELMRRDAVVAHVLDFRKHLVAGLAWYLEPASQSPVDLKVAQILDALLRAIPNFASARFNLAEAVIRGEAWAGLRGAFVQRSVASGPVRRWWTITGLVDIDKRRFRQEKRQEIGQPPKWTWQIERVYQHRWEDIELRHYVHHVHGTAEGSLGRGQGVGSVIWHYWRQKIQCLKLWLQRLDRWALGNLVAKIALDDKSRRDPANAERIQSWLKVLEKMRSGHVAVFDAKDAIELVEATGTGSEIREALSYHDESITRAGLGAVLPTGGSQGVGSYARADVEAESTEAVISFDHQNLEETLDHGVLELLYHANLKNIIAQAGGFPSGPSNFRIRGGRRQDPLVEAQIVEIALRNKIPLKKIEVYAALRFTPPAQGDDVFVSSDPLAPAVGAPGASSPQGPPSDAMQARDRAHRILKAAQGARGIKPAGDQAPRSFEATDGADSDPGASSDGESTMILQFKPQINVAAPPAPPAVVVPAPIVHVAAPNVVIAAPPAVVVPAPQVTVEAPQVTVEAAAPVVIPPAVCAPVINVQSAPKESGDKKVVLERDSFGRVSGFEIKPEKE